MKKTRTFKTEINFHSDLDETSLLEVLEKYNKSTVTEIAKAVEELLLIRLYNESNEVNNPIKDNRIVKDKTFALRLLNFALDTETNCCAGEEEKESMVSYSTELLKHQIKTATDSEEIDYLKRCNARKKLSAGLEFLGKPSVKD